MTSHRETGQQPGVCRDCLGSKVYFVSNHGGERWVDCDTCNGTGQQPAQPENREVVRYPSSHAAIYMKDTVLASDYDRLQSSLTAAQQRLAMLERALEYLSLRRPHSDNSEYGQGYRQAEQDTAIFAAATLKASGGMHSGTG